MKIRSLFNPLMLLFAIVLFFAQIDVAFAQAPPTGGTVAPSSAPFTTHPDDYFMKELLSGFLGNGVIDPTGAAASSTITGDGNLGEIFRVFNLGVAFFGSIMVLFITLVGVLQSGNDGEFLGRKWSSMWVPVRFTVGSMLMLPLTNSGFSFVQAMVLWIAAQGVGFADTLWDTIVDKVMVHGRAQVWGNLDAPGIVSHVLKSEVCSAALTKYTLGSDPQLSPWFKSAVKTGTTGAGSATRGMITLTNKWGDASPFSDVCGSLTMAYMAKSSDPYSDLRVKLGDTHVAAVEDMQKVFHPLAIDYIAKLSSIVPGEAALARKALIDAAGVQSRNYSDVITKKAEELITAATPASDTALIASMKARGFVAAGMFYIDMTRMHGAVRTAIGDAPLYREPDVSNLAPETLENYRLMMIDYQQVITALKTSISEDSSKSVTVEPNTTVSSSAASMFDIDISSKMDTTSLITGIGTKAAAWGIRVMFGVGDNTNGDSYAGSAEWWKHMPGTDTAIGHSNQYSAIMQLKNKGDNILDVAAIMMMGLAGFEGLVAGVNDASIAVPVIGAPTAGISGFFKGLLHIATPMLFSLIFSFIAFGFTLAIYVPMVPYVLWMGGVTGFLILIAEALVASPLWAVMIMHPSGEGVTSQQSQNGLMLLLGLFTRPALMLMGMILGMFMVEPLVMMINDTFFYAMSSVQAGSVTMLFSFVGYAALYVSLILTVVNKCFSLIHVMPDKVLRWIGGGGEQLGEGSARDHAKGTVAAVAATAAGSASKFGSRERAPKVAKDPKGGNETKKADFSGFNLEVPK